MDIDIDLKTTFDPLTVFNTAIRASMIKSDELTKHPCGVYFQAIPIDSITNLAAIPYEAAEELGYFKIDFLKLSVLDQCESKQQIRQLIKQAPDWKMLQDREIVKQLFQIHGHYNILNEVKPTSILELADTIALIRPGKRQLLQQYLKDKQATRSLLYSRTDDGYFFKKSHAISYALTIILQLHLLSINKTV